MIALAFFYMSVWPLVAGMLVQSFCKVVFSHVVVPGPKVGFGFDKEVAKKVVHFGKWIFLSTAAMYATTHGDKLILAKLIPAGELGVYAVSAIFGYVLKDIVANVSGRMLLPVYRQIVENGDSLKKMFKPRWGLLLLAFIGSILLSAFGEALIKILYDERYENAGWVLQLLAFAGMCHSFDNTIRSFLVANRDSYHSFCVQALKGVVFICLSLWLSSEYGIMGMLIAMAFTPLITLPYLMYVVSLHGYKWFYFDFLAVVVVVISFFSLWFFQGGLLWVKLSAFLEAFFR
jgi:O-antigen/teichoic acid export membrane protein